MRTLPFTYYVFESKYGELSLELSKSKLYEYKSPSLWTDWTDEPKKFQFEEG
jgi:hypothetical protein